MTATSPRTRLRDLLFLEFSLRYFATSAKETMFCLDEVKQDGAFCKILDEFLGRPYGTVVREVLYFARDDFFLF